MVHTSTPDLFNLSIGYVMVKTNEKHSNCRLRKRHKSHAACTQ